MSNKLCQLLRQHWALLLLLGICIAIRILMLTNSRPLDFNDSDSYRKLAVELKTLNFSSYLGERPPAYPLLILLSGMNDYVIWVVQSGLGIATSVLLYFMAMRLTGNKIISLIVGLSYSLSLQMLSFEAMILTETLAAFLLVLSLYLLIVAVDKKSIALYVLAGFGAGTAALTRPVFLFLAPLIVIYLFFMFKLNNETLARITRYLGGFLIPVIILVGGWSLFNKVKVDYFGITTLAGYYLTDHSGAFIQNAPPEYSVVRDIYISYRDKTATHVGVIWYAVPAMQKATGLSFSELSRVLTKMSIQLFIKYPGAYLIGAFRGWNDYWIPAFGYADYSSIRSIYLKKILTYLSIIEMSLFSHLNSIFLLITVWTLVRAMLKPRILDFNLLFILIAFIASILQSLLEYGENPRYAIPFYPLILFVVITWLYYLFREPLNGWRFDKKIQRWTKTEKAIAPCQP